MSIADENPEVRKLAETLRSSGVAASDLDAVMKAKSILEITTPSNQPTVNEMVSGEVKEEPQQVAEPIREQNQTEVPVQEELEGEVEEV